jgi:mono/diheme cytochrome c family protein
MKKQFRSSAQALAGAVLLALPVLLSAVLTGCAAKPRTGPALSAADPEAARRGEYLFDAANCTGCHTDSKHGGARLAGGGALETPFGTYYSRNITPDPVYGIGAWSDADFLQALRRGIAPDGGHYFSAFPFPAFTFMSDRDILDIRAYLATQKPVAQPNRPHDVGFPFDMRLSMVLWRSLYFTPGPLAPDPAQSAAWNRGAYLATAVAHCGECHTPRTALGGLDQDRRFGGNRLSGAPGKLAPNISTDPKDGIGRWQAADIVDLLKSGMTPNGDFVTAPMSEVVDGTAKLTDDDRMAIATYLKSLTAVPGKGG